QIPVASFTDENANTPGADDGFDYANLLQVVFAYGGLQGPEFTFLIDELGFSNEVTVANEPGTTPGGVALSSAYPNPFASRTQFALTLDQAESVRVEVFDVLGRRVALLHDGLLGAQTAHTFGIDGRAWGSGMYLYRATGETFSETRRVVLTK
ncbi:MAG: T9SS type A sorting domain-containing protein, partial [Bacteroidota bacterium]